MVIAGVAATATAEQPEEVLGLLREQATLFARLETFADRQRHLVTEDDTRPLLALLVDRRNLSTELTRIAGRLAPVRRDWAAFRESLSPPQKTEADGLVEDATQRLRRLIESDERDARLLSVRKRVTGDALRATHATGQAMSAYRMRSERTAGAGRLDEAS
ncbi:MAG: hypothetical protein Q7R41_09125 [Phycisphaerales bacterium]|nr:hypothetical protein [Phycisphaerales bacterium]